MCVQVSASGRLQSQLEGANGMMEELQERYNAKINKLKTEIEVCNRRCAGLARVPDVLELPPGWVTSAGPGGYCCCCCRVQNAKYVSEANEVLAAESQVSESFRSAEHVWPVR